VDNSQRCSGILNKRKGVYGIFIKPMALSSIFREVELIFPPSSILSVPQGYLQGIFNTVVHCGRSSAMQRCHRGIYKVFLIQ